MIKKFLPLISFSLFAFSLIYIGKNGKFSRRPSSLRSKRIFIGVDGFDKRSFDYAQQELGLFKPFKKVSVHIAPFPSISDYSWNKIVHSKDIYGHKGRIKNYEAAYYDASKNTIVDDTREYFRRIGQENHYYAGAFEIFFNPYVESFLYLPSKKLPVFELEQLRNEILSDSNSDMTSVLVASIDAIAHTQADNEFLIYAFDEFINGIIEDHKSIGVDAEVILVSDHGQDFDFKLGTKAKELKVAKIQDAFKKAGFNITKNLSEKNDIALPLMALGNYASIHFKDLSQREFLVEKIQNEPWFEHSVFIEKKLENKCEVKVYDSKGLANIFIKKLSKDRFRFIYKPISSNPLEIEEKNINRILDSEKLLEQSKTSNFPDALYRIAQAVFEDEADFPDMILTLKGEYRVKGDLDQFTKMFRTHGSLHRNSTNGIVTSNKNSNYPTHIRTDDILKTIGITVDELFEDNKNKGLLSNFEASYQNKSGSIQTGAQNYSSKRVFGLINRFVNYSQYVLSVDSIETFKSLFKSGADQMASNQSLTSMNLDLSETQKVQVLSMEDMGTLLDIVLETPEWQKIEEDSRFIEIKARVLAELKKLNNAPNMTGDSHTHLSQEELLEQAAPHTHAGKTMIMKQYSLPFLFKKSLSFPEFETIDDSRDFEFAKVVNDHITVTHSYKGLNERKESIQKLFKEIFNERIIVDDLKPHKVKTLYNSPTKEDITFVYIPGIYNSIFNNEIFAMGIDALKNNLGLRVIQAPMKSACDSNYNGDLLVDFIKKDIEYRKSRGRKKTKYFLMGYSKGAVDALYSFAKNENFIKENIQGLLSIASPIGGSSILAKSDVPIMLLELLGAESIPEVCREKQWASKTITPDAANRFFKKEGAKLSTLTRYYSVSFSSDIKESHLWMQATKQIAGFQEKNDGVVELSASRFPKGFGAVDLGVVEADHLSGIVASEFPQVAFMESLYITLEKIGAFDSSISKRWLKNVKYDSSYTLANEHREKIKKLIGVKSLQESSLSKIEDKIKSNLKGTLYEVDDFELDRNFDGSYSIEYHVESKTGLYSMIFHLNEETEIEDIDDLVTILLEKIQLSGKDLLISEKEAWRNYPVSEREKIVLPSNNLTYLSDYRINLRQISSLMNGSIVQPFKKEDYKDGINIIYDHQTSKQFRDEYKLNYESSSSFSPDNNPESGWISHLTAEKEVVARMSSKNSSIRLTTFSMRFKPIDFPKLNLNIKVSNNVEGANVLFGGSGKDDSAFQVWYTIRINKEGAERDKFDPDAESFIFGYYWGDKIQGKELVDGEIYENYYSKKNFIVAVLPEAKQLLLGHKLEDMNKFQSFERNIYEDLKKAFPNRDIKNAEIIGITFQHDSNDTKGDSESFFKSMSFK